MSVDPKIIEAIDSAVSEAGQPPTLSRRISAWLEAITSGNEDVHDSSAAGRHLEALYEQTVTSTDEVNSHDG